MFCWGFSQGPASEDRYTQGCCWPHHLWNRHPRGQNQQHSQRGIIPHRKADVSGTLFHFRTVFQLWIMASLPLFAIILGCHGCRVFRQNPGTHRHHGLHLLQHGNDLRWILHAKHLFLKICIRLVSSLNQTCMSAFVSCAHLFVLPFIVRSCWSDCCRSVWHCRGRRSGVHVRRPDPSQP